ncbi:hypothetical protein MMC16_001375 [Acarospora aff. strigata]|nr:hypothetical protein [Acarospora aff. strigata]
MIPSLLIYLAIAIPTARGAPPPSKAPSLSISLHLEPPIYKITDPIVPTLSVHANLDAAQPITVCTWHTILHPRQALQQNCFEIIDKATNLPVPQQSKKNKRPAIMPQYGTPDEHLFVTLTPQSPYTIQTPFGPSPLSLSPSAGQMQERTDPLSTREPVYGVRGLKKGDYALRVSRAEGASCQIGWWRYSTKEANLEPASADRAVIDCSLGASAEPSPLMVDAAAIPPVDFSVR